MTNLLEEEGGHDKTPDPLETIDAFESAHNILLGSVASLHASPSVKGVQVVEEKIEAANGSVYPLYRYDFFKDFDNEAIVDAALRAVMTATEELAAKTKDIHPAWPATVNYEEDHKEIALSNVMSDMDGATEAQVAAICGAYKTMAKNLEGAVMDCKTVTDFMRKKARRNEITHELARFGLIVAATYVGSKLAQKDNSTKR